MIRPKKIYFKMEKEHIPVLKDEVIKILNIKKNGIYLDLTLGNGGHSSEILKIIKNHGKLFAFDVDKSVIDNNIKKLDKISHNYEIIHNNYKNFAEEMLKRKITKADGILIDLGISSMQIANGKRGFSYNINGKLDMRMNQDDNNLLTARYIVNNYTLQQLKNIFIENGEEKDAYKIAKNIIKYRKKKSIDTTFELVDIIKNSKTKKTLLRKGHPAKKVFQALRIEVNDELNILKNTLPKLLSFLNKNGILVVISFHSLEDRIVKNIFNQYTRYIGNRNDDCEKSKEYIIKFKLLTKHVIVPNDKEKENNPCSKSAKLRAIKKIF